MGTTLKPNTNLGKNRDRIAVDGTYIATVPVVTTVGAHAYKEVDQFVVVVDGQTLDVKSYDLKTVNDVVIDHASTKVDEVVDTKKKLTEAVQQSNDIQGQLNVKHVAGQELNNQRKYGNQKPRSGKL